MVTGEAVRVVRVAEGRDHSPLHILSTCLALGAVECVVVCTAVVVSLLHEVAARGQETVAH